MVAWLLTGSRAAHSAGESTAKKDIDKFDDIVTPTEHTTSTCPPVADAEADAPLPKRQISEDIAIWKKDGSNGHYHSLSSLCLVMWAQILYIVSLVIIIPTAARYAEALGAKGPICFGLIVGISSVVDPVVSRLWNHVIKVTSLRTVLLMNASINVASCGLYVLASFMPRSTALPILLISRCILGFGSVQTAYLQYLGRGVSNKKVTFAHFLTTASISYGFAFGICLAFGLSAVATACDWSQNLAPGWFSALLWLLYIPIHCSCFVEPDQQAGIVDPESRIRLAKGMRPKMRREPFAGLVPCFIAIFVIAVVKSSFEVMTIEVTKHVWHLDVMKSALFLGFVMFVVALTTLLAYVMQKSVGQGRIFLCGLAGATVLLPIYFIPVTEMSQIFVSSESGMAVYLLISILTLSFLNVGRTIAFSLTTELPSPQWRDYFLANASSLFTMGRGFGPILVGALAEKQLSLVLIFLIGCFVMTLCVTGAYLRGKLEHDEHEVGPARAETEDPHSLQQQIVDHWLNWNGCTGVLDDCASHKSCDLVISKMPDTIQSPDAVRELSDEQGLEASTTVAWVFD